MIIPKIKSLRVVNQQLITVFYNLKTVIILKKFKLTDAQVHIDPEVLNDAVDRYWKDVQRLKDHHGIHYNDCHKIAGYLTYWICKLRPIQITDPKVYDIGDQARLFNEWVSLLVSCGRINQTYREKGLSKRTKPSEKFVSSLFYTLRYRPTNADKLAIIYYFLDECS